MQHLIQVLLHGYSYTTINGEGDTKLINVPPNRHMRAAGSLIIDMLKKIEAQDKIIVNLQQQLNEYRKNDKA